MMFTGKLMFPFISASAWLEVSPLGVGNDSRRGAKMVNLLSALVGISKVDRGVSPSVLQVPLAAGV